STYQRSKAHTLKCIFTDLIKHYKAYHLKPCETSELQTWRHANSANIAKNLLKYHNYIPELAEHHSSLADYSIC
ncbi:27715_t:CDS:1, partial [Gigaspora margarita]